jgi:hypothetical protein
MIKDSLNEMADFSTSIAALAAQSHSAFDACPKSPFLF